jgi:predicted RNA polymerase sigma factor
MTGGHEINYNSIRAAINDTSSPMDKFNRVVRDIAQEAAHAVAGVLFASNVDPSTLPGEYFIQAALLAAQSTFTPVTKESWTKLWEAYEAVIKLMEDNPELVEMRRQALAAETQQVAGPETSEVDALLADIFGEGK